MSPATPVAKPTPVPAFIRWVISPVNSDTAAGTRAIARFNTSVKIAVNGAALIKSRRNLKIVPIPFRLLFEQPGIISLLFYK